MTAIPELEGAAAYPRRNGEPVFEEPWESRAFGMVASLYQRGAFEWDEFKQHLIARIARGAPDGRYYEHWMAAFHDLAIAKSLLTPGEIAARESEFRDGVRRDVW